MHEIEQQAIANYHTNLAYFKKSHPDLYTKLTTFEAAISSHQYLERYSLEYKNGYFDVLEISTNSYLYGSNSIEYSTHLSHTFDSKKSGGVFEGQVRFDIDPNVLDELEKDSHFHSSLWATARILECNARLGPKAVSEMVTLYKFIFLGTGLGLHIKPVLDITDSKVVYIQEDNLELFRLSLFTTDYSALDRNRKLFFSIGAAFHEKQHLFFSFLNQLFNHNLYIKYLPFYSQYDHDLQELQSITLSQNHIMYPYQAFMARSYNAANKVMTGKTFLNVSHRYSDTVFSSKPVLILGAGPSIQAHTDWIRHNQDKFIIFAVLSVCKHLYTYKIQPDVILHIDPQEISVKLIEGIAPEFFKDTYCIFGSSVHQSLFNTFDEHRTIYIEEATRFKADFGHFTLPTIGEYSATLALILGASSLYLLGIDQSLDPDTMKDHIDLHIASQALSEAEIDADASVEFQKSICYVKGNFLDVVPTKPNFRLSITQFDRAISEFKRPHQTIYNLANGAYLPHTIPQRAHDIPVQTFLPIQKMELSNELEKFFHRNASSAFRDHDKDFLDIQIKKAKTVLSKTKKLRSKKIKDPKNYVDNRLLPFVSEIAELAQADKSDIGEIYFEFFKIVLSFACDIFNTKKLSHVATHAEEVDRMVLEAVEKIANHYIRHMTGSLHR